MRRRTKSVYSNRVIKSFPVQLTTYNANLNMDREVSEPVTIQPGFQRGNEGSKRVTRDNQMKRTEAFAFVRITLHAKPGKDPRPRRKQGEAFLDPETLSPKLFH